MKTKERIALWIGRLLPGAAYLIALGLLLTGPALIAAAVVVALVFGDSLIAAACLLAGGIVGACGALATLACLGRSLRREEEPIG